MIDHNAVSDAFDDFQARGFCVAGSFIMAYDLGPPGFTIHRNHMQICPICKAPWLEYAADRTRQRQAYLEEKYGLDFSLMEEDALGYERRLAELQDEAKSAAPPPNPLLAEILAEKAVPSPYG